MTLQARVVSPERVLFEGEAIQVLVRTTGGDIMFQTGHAPFVGLLGIGEVRIWKTDGEIERAAVHGGYVEVSDNTVTVLSDTAELASQIDVARARTSVERAEAALRHEHDAEAEAALRRAHVRLAVAGAPTEAH